MTVGFWFFLRMPDGPALAWVGMGFADYTAGGPVPGFLCAPTVPNVDARAG